MVVVVYRRRIRERNTTVYEPLRHSRCNRQGVQLTTEYSLFIFAIVSLRVLPMIDLSTRQKRK